MNKKLVLSVLSTAVVASMASSAMAKPAAGIYIGGQVDKYYGAVAFLDNIDTALDEVLDNLSVSVFVDGEGNAAPMLEALTADDINDVLEPAQRDLFEENDYAIVGGEGAWHPEDEDDWVTGELAVESVSAIDVTTVEVAFKAPVGASAKLKGTYTIYDTADFSKVAVNSVTVSEDNKTVTLKTNTLAANKRYLVRFTGMTDANGQVVALDDQYFNSPEFPTTEPAATDFAADAVKVLRNGDDANDVSAILTVQLPAGVNVANTGGTITADRTVIDVLDSTGNSVLVSGTTMTVDSNGLVRIDLGSDTSTPTVEPVLTAGDAYTVQFQAAALTNRYNVSNTNAVDVNFTASEATVAAPQVKAVQITAAADAGTSLTLKLETDTPVSVANGVVGYLIDDEGNAIDLTATAINAGSEATEVELTSDAITAGDVEAGKQYVLVITAGKFTSELGATNTAYQTTVAGVDTVAPSLVAAELKSAGEAVFTFDKEIALKDAYSISFAGVTFDGTNGNEATVSGNTLTLTSEDREIPTAIDTGLALDVTGGVEIASGVDATYSDTLIADDADASNDSTDQSFLVDNASVEVLSVAESAGTVTITFSENVIKFNGNDDGNDTVDALIGNVEYASDAITSGGATTVSFSNVDDVVAGETTLYLAPNALVSAEDEDDVVGSKTLTIE